LRAGVNGGQAGSHVGDHHRHHERAAAIGPAGQIDRLLVLEDLNAANASPDDGGNLAGIALVNLELRVR